MIVQRLLGLLAVLELLSACSLCSSENDQAAVESRATAKGGAPAAAAPSASAAAPRPEPPRRPQEPLNVLVITVDSLRADMPWTGYDKPIAPNLTKLAESSVVYTHAYSLSSYTAKSVATMLTGRYASTLYRDGYFFAGYSKANVFFPEVLQERDIATFSWHGHMYFSANNGLNQGFDTWEVVRGISFNAQTDEHVTSQKMTELGIELMKKPEHTGKQFFAWAHYMDPHDEYIQHEGTPVFGKGARARYDSEVHHTDHWIGVLLDFAKKQPWWKKTALIISADHGEAFGDHGMYKHAFEVWEVLTRVPLIVHAPGVTVRQIHERRGAIDLAPTIMDLMGQKPLEGSMGKSLVPELYGAEPEKREVIVTELAEDTNNPPRRAVIRGDDLKLIHFLDSGRFAFFDLKSDPNEEKDLAEQQPEKLKEMKAFYQTTYDAIPTVAPYGGMKLRTGKIARGPAKPPEEKPPADKTPTEKPGKDSPPR